jgi:hypothetical protein
VGASVNKDRGVRGGTVDKNIKDNPVELIKWRLANEVLTDEKIRQLLYILSKIDK